MDQGQDNAISTSNYFFGEMSRGFGLDEVISKSLNRTASLPERTGPELELNTGEPVVINNNALHQQEILPPLVPFDQNNQAQVEGDFQAPEQPNLFNVSQDPLHPELFHQVGNMEMGPNYGFPDASATAQDKTVTGLGNGNYHLPLPNFPEQLHQDSSSVQPFPILEPCPQNPYGAANGAPPPCLAPPPCFPTINDPGLQQPQFSQPSIRRGRRLTRDRGRGRMQSRGLSRSSTARRISNNQTQSSNTHQQAPMGNIHPIPIREAGESSSRNVRMKTSLSQNTQYQQSTEFQGLINMPNLTTQSNGNPQQPRDVMMSPYDRFYELMGLPVDPHMRLFKLYNYRF